VRCGASAARIGHPAHLRARPSAVCWPTPNLILNATILFSPATEGRPHHSRQAPLRLQGNWSTPANEGALPHRTVWKTLLDRKCLLGGKTQTLLPRPRKNHPYRIPSGSVARLGLQSLSLPIARLLTRCPEDVNRAKEPLGGIRSVFQELWRNKNTVLSGISVFG